MPRTRRDFLKTAALAGGALIAPVRPRPRRALRILVLGGTSFIGPFQVQYALDRGHEVTLFNRGRTNIDLFPGLEKLRGDRSGDLEALRGRRWDVVIDNSATNPEWVRLSARLLRDAVDRYLYVSSRSAYEHFRQVPMTATAPTFTYESAGVDPSTPGADLPYGLAKAQSEREVTGVFARRATILRPGLIIGPRDETDRFTYWPVRVQRGGEILAPGDGTDGVQIIDARDLAEWMIRLAEDGRGGTFNAVGPAWGRSFAELLHGIRAVTTVETRFTWVDTDFLLDRGIRPYSDLPVWMPARGDDVGFARFDLSREVAAGLTFRSLANTTIDTLAYHFSRPPARREALRAGLAPEREREVLREWGRR
jgi:2'-hydroxyisoflavone reductase